MRPLVLRGGRVIDPSRGFDQTADVPHPGRQDRRGRRGGSALPTAAEVRDVRGHVRGPPGSWTCTSTCESRANEDVENDREAGARARRGGRVHHGVRHAEHRSRHRQPGRAVGFIVRQSVRAGLARACIRSVPSRSVQKGRSGSPSSAEDGGAQARWRFPTTAGPRGLESPHAHGARVTRAPFEIPVADHCEEPTPRRGRRHARGDWSPPGWGSRGIPRGGRKRSWWGADVLLAGPHRRGTCTCATLSTRGSVRADSPRQGSGGARHRRSHPASPHAHRARLRALRYARQNEPTAARSGGTWRRWRAALKEGVIDCIASDHAPHAYDAKEAAFDDAPLRDRRAGDGVFAVGLHRGSSWEASSPSPSLVHRMSTAPSRRVPTLPGGTLKPGAAADVVSAGHHAAGWTVDPAAFFFEEPQTPRLLAGP